MTINTSLIIGLGVIGSILYISHNIFRLIENDRQIEELRKKIENQNKEEYEGEISIEEALKEWDK